jgi:hypothetical protein
MRNKLKSYYKPRHAKLEVGDTREMIDRHGKVKAIGKVVKVSKDRVQYMIIAE